MKIQNKTNLIKFFATSLVCSQTYALAQHVTVLLPNEASKEAHQVNTRLNWQNSLAEVLKEAKRTKRLVFWVHMLGSMDGKT